MALRKGKARRAHAPDAGSHSRASERAPSKRGGSKRNGAARSPLRRLIYWSLVLALWALIAVVGTIAFAVSTLPPIQTLEVPKRPPTIEIVGTDGRPLITRGEMSGTDISIKELPPYLPRAFVAIEDRRFFSHFGIDPIGLIRAAAALRYAAAKHVRGGGADKPDRVDSEMAEEAPILDCDECPRQIGRKLVDRDIGAAHLAAGDERPRVGADDLDGRRALGDFE